MNLEWRTTSVGDVTLVAAVLENETALDRRVRVTNCLDGPVLPPRRDGVPEVGWDRRGATVDVTAASSRAVGYACPVSDGGGDADPPLVVESVDAPDSTGVESNPSRAATRRTGDPRPPRSVVASDDERTAETAGDESNSPSPSTAADGDDGDDSGAVPLSAPSGQQTKSASGPADTLPPAVRCWLDSLRSRAETLESLDGASVEEATMILDRVGGLDAIENRLDDEPRDVDSLRAVADEASSLADRLENRSVPLSALVRLS